MSDLSLLISESQGIDNRSYAYYNKSMNAVLIESSGVVTPLYGHTSAETAYLVPDYPYGRTVRTRIRYWLEIHPRKGARFVSQTEKPGTSHWNAPKKSTYQLFGAMYLDSVGHVQWKGISPFSSAEEVLAFVRDFPGATAGIRNWVDAKVASLVGKLDGRLVFRINGQVQPWTDADNARHRAELAVWQEIDKLVR